MRILIVDDEPEIRDSLAEFLECEGYSVATASNGSEALTCLQRQDLPSLVVLDLLMPGITGNQVYESMQNDARLAGIPVIISTSDPSRAPGGVLVMRKPLNLDRLLGVVRQYSVQLA